MWFQFPKGCSRISVERQEFSAEALDEAGREYFRAPNHFAPKILALPGFAAVDPPDGAPDDLSNADPLRDSAISDLSRHNDALREELTNLRSDLGAANAKIVALTNEKVALEAEIEQLKHDLEVAREEQEDAPAPAKGKR
jgi:hypothetical protein